MKLTEVSDLRVYKLLAKLNPTKASDSDEIPNLMLKECVEILAFTISRINPEHLRSGAAPSPLMEAGSCITTIEKTGEGP